MAVPRIGRLGVEEGGRRTGMVRIERVERVPRREERVGGVRGAGKTGVGRRRRGEWRVMGVT